MVPFARIADIVPTSTRQFALQFASLLAVLCLAWPYHALRDQPLTWSWISLAVGATAFCIASLSRQPWWWRLIHAGFAPAVWIAAQIHLSPHWYLAAFIGLFLIYRGALSGQIPLYCSNIKAADALIALAQQESATHLLDLGAGVGSMMAPLAASLPAAQVTGCENAPLTWAIGRIRLHRYKNALLHFGDLWQADLAHYDLIYAFLSPEPMAELGHKVVAEMKPNTCFVSNSFPIPWAECTHVIEVNDTRHSKLYCYEPEDLRRQWERYVACHP